MILKKKLLFNMNSKFCVSLEAAKLLKEKGYDRECVAYYQNDEFRPYSLTRSGLSTYNKNAAPSYMNQYSAPIKDEAIDWLESKGIVIIVEEYYIMHEEDDYCTLCWGYRIIKDDEAVCRDNSSDYKTRLEAKDAAIIKGCELLENGN